MKKPQPFALKARPLNKWVLPVVLGGILVYFFSSMGTQTFRQRLLQMAYPLLMRVSKSSGNGMVLTNEANKVPPQNFYDLKVVMNNGQAVPLSQYKGSKILLVNTASDCGYTGQYEALQQLWQRYKGRLVIIGFPANDFKQQEKGSDDAIAAFCKLNYGVQFPLAQKSTVLKKPGQHPVFTWLSHAAQNGWNDQAPQWNFSKYLINERGVLTHYFGPAIAPTDKAVIAAIEKQ